MFALLDPRIWMALALVAALSFTHVFTYRAGKANVRSEWQAATAAANLESFKASERRQAAVDKAATAGAARQAGIRTDSARAGDSVIRLRHAISAQRSAEESAAAATKRADTLGELLVEGAEAYRQLAQSCDRHVSDIRLLLEAWPQ
jgi:hypothetical protein